MEKNQLIPEHRILTKKEKQDFLNKYNISETQMPKIFINDPALIDLNPKENDIVEIKRIDGNKVSYYYRVVIKKTKFSLNEYID